MQIVYYLLVDQKLPDLLYEFMDDMSFTVVCTYIRIALVHVRLVSLKFTGTRDQTHMQDMTLPESLHRDC